MNIWQNSKDYVSCPNIINFYNNNMDGADIMDQKTAAYRLDRKSKYHFYLRMLFDLIDVPHETCDDMSLLNFKIVVAKALIGRYSNHKGSFPTSSSSKRKHHEPSMTREVPAHESEF